MKVAISHTRYSYVGGVEKYIYSLVERLLDEGHEVHYFCHFWDSDADPRIRFHKIPNPFKAVRFLKVWSFDRWSEQAIAADDFDIVHGFTKTARQDIYTDGSGCLLDYQEYSLREGNVSPTVQKLKALSPHQRLVENLERERFTRGNFHRIIAMSDFARQQILKRYELEPSEVDVIYNGIDLGHFNPQRREELREEMRSRLNYTSNDVVALLVGNDYRRKGVETVIEAARMLKESGGLPDGRKLRFAIVGKERPGRERVLYDRVKALNMTDDVRFFGPQREIAEWHAMSDVHILPTRFDIFGNVVLEAMAMGIPTIVSRMAGAAEVVRPGETGEIHEDPKDAEELVRLLHKVCDDPATIAAQGEAARKEAEQYSWDRHFARMMEVYAAVKAEKSGAAPSSADNPETDGEKDAEKAEETAGSEA